MNYFILIPFFLLLSENLAGDDNDLSDTDYCNLETCRNNKKEHTICKYPKGGAVSPCKLEQLTKDQKIRLLKLHNGYREKVANGSQEDQPSASNMLRLRWDFELEAVAGRWAAQCMDGHDKCRSSRRFPVGQNIGFRSNWDLDWNVDEWFGEVKDFKADGSDGNGGVDSYKVNKVKDTGHYTQVVWAGTYLVGCAYTDGGSGKRYRYALFCNYGPAGNMIGAPVYKKGDAAKECPEGSSPDTDFPGLCARPGPDFPEQKLHPSLSEDAGSSVSLSAAMSLVVLLAVGALAADW